MYAMITLKCFVKIMYNYVCSLHTSVPVQLTVSDGGISPTLGRSYTLICNVTIAVSAYRWRENGIIIDDENGRVLFFPTLHLSDAGNYSCEVEVASTTYTATENKTIAFDCKSKSYY